MKKTIVVCSSNRDMEQRTKQSLQAMTREGALYLEQLGSSDAAMARNLALTGCVDALHQYPERDLVLMIDDDMVLPLPIVHTVVAEARARGRPTAAAYATKTGMLAGKRFTTDKGERRWLVGLGCLAIPAQLLLELAAKSETFALRDRIVTQFTWAKADNGAWMAEDYRLSERLGGVDLLPLAVGHVKKIPLWPDQYTLDAIRDDTPLAADPDPRASEGIS